MPRNARTHGRSHPDGGRQQLHHLHWQSQDGAELPPARPQRERAAGVDHSPGAGQAPEDGCEENVRIRHQSGAGRLDTEHPAVSVTPCGRCRQPDAGPIVLRRRVRPPPKSNRCHTSVFTCCGILPKHAMTMLVCFPNVLPCGGRRAGQGSGEVVALLTQHVRRQPLLPLGPRISPARPLQVPVGGGGPSADIDEGPAEPHGAPAAGATACCCGGAGSRGLPAEGLCRDRDRALGGGSAAVAGCSPPLPPLPSALPTCHV